MRVLSRLLLRCSESLPKQAIGLLVLGGGGGQPFQPPRGFGGQGAKPA
jgi:hypothetical protein